MLFLKILICGHARPTKLLEKLGCKPMICHTKEYDPEPSVINLLCTLLTNNIYGRSYLSGMGGGASPPLEDQNFYFPLFWLTIHKVAKRKILVVGLVRCWKEKIWNLNFNIYFSKRPFHECYTIWSNCCWIVLCQNWRN